MNFNKKTITIFEIFFDVNLYVYHPDIWLRALWFYGRHYIFAESGEMCQVSYIRSKERITYVFYKKFFYVTQTYDDLLIYQTEIRNEL